MPMEDLRRTFLREARSDDVGLWLLVRWVRDALGPDCNADEVREKTLGFLEEMLRNGRIRAGHPDGERRRFVAWPFDAQEAVARIRTEWEALGREPKLGEIVWFTATDHGEHEKMGEQNIVRMSAEEARRRREAGESRTDYERLRNLTDEEIEQAVRDDPDAPPLLDEDWFEKAEFVPGGVGKTESDERSRALGDLRALVERLQEREQWAEEEGMQELAEHLARDRARLAGAVKGLARERQAPREDPADAE
jgi:hypothetical protein